MKPRSYFFVLLFAMPAVTYAFSWTDLWLTPDQQAQKLMAKGHYKQAENSFRRQDWSAAAAYRSGHYQQAAQLFGAQQNSQGYYNQGNALAHLGQYEKALQAYDKVLNLEPDHRDALHNRKIVADLLKQEKQKQEQEDREQQGKAPENKAPENKAPENKAPENKAPENKAPENKAPENKAPENKAPENKAPENKMAETSARPSPEEREKQQAKEQWLRVIPDDPGGLMREKFLRDHLRRQRGWYQ